MMRLKTQAQMAVALMAVPDAYRGVALRTNCDLPLLLDRLSGSRTAHPTAAMSMNMFRHMRRIRRKMVASSPICVIRSCSLVKRTGLTQAKMPLPRAGGACWSSATLSLGAYTRELYGRRRENARVRRTVMRTEVPRPASTLPCASYSYVRHFYSEGG